MLPDAGPPRLRTLGSLDLDHGPPTRRKPLLLAAFLALEGRQPRRRLAELLFASAERPSAALSVALSRLRAALGPAVVADARTAAVTVALDTEPLLHALERGDLASAEAAYAGPFLEGIDLRDTSAEFEEWALETREFLAGQVREARLEAAERLLRHGRVEEAGDHAEHAIRTPGCADAEPATLERARHVLVAAGRASARRLERDLRDWGIEPSEGPPVAPRSLPAAAGTTAPVGDLMSADLVGRESELARLSELLVPTGPRVVSLVGPGGIGKTLLATHAAARAGASDAFPDGIHVVPLVDVADAARVADRVAQSLAVTLTADEPAETRLTRALADRRCLVVLDDGERLLDGVRTLLDGLRRAGGVHWLVTSREPVGAFDEHVLPLDGLAVPDDPTATPDRLARFAAVTLYLRRRRRWSAAGPGADTWEPLARLCQDLGGWPLALEIAASLERVVPLPHLTAELRRDLRLLEHPDRPLDDRQHSITCVLDASWERLEPRDRTAAERLCCFRSSFTRDDAAAVADVSVSSLVRLIERSLVRQRGAGRFDLHPLVARHAAARAAASGATPALERRHAEHFTALLARHEGALAGTDRVAVGAALTRSHGDLRSAWTWSVEHGEDAWWQRCVRAFARYLEVTGRYRDGAAWLGLAVARVERIEAAADARAMVALAHATLLARAARFEEARVAMRPALESSDAGLVAQANETLGGQVALWLGAYEDAAAHVRAAAAHYRDVGDAFGVARCAFLEASVVYDLGDLAAAEALLHPALEAFEAQRDAHWSLLTRAALALVWLETGRASEAERTLEAIREAAGGQLSDHARAVVDANLVRVRHASGRACDSATIEAVLATFERVGDDPWVAEAGALAARLHASAGAHDRARSALRRALTAGLRRDPAPHLAHPIAAVADLVAGRAPDDARRLHALVAASSSAPATLRRSSRTSLGDHDDGSAAAGDADRSLRDVARRLLDGGSLPSGVPLDEAIRA